ncbi:MAG: Zn-dependent exopeptidase M28 [Thermoplasmatales archaeon]|nr:MAG: Zn-dependent exopeptidase M28 [Thermoplasmatales archaeon]
MNSKHRIIIVVGLCTISLILITIPISSTSINKISPIKSQNFTTRNAPPDIIEMIQKVNKSRLIKHVQTIQDFGPHPTGSEELDLVGEYIYKELINTKLPVEYLTWSNKKYSGKNIVASLQGIGKTDGIIIICAHYDSIKISPGADDDGSGVAIVLMIAEIMSNYSFNTTIKFILFSGEEQGLLGSSAYATNAKKNGENIIGVLALDKVGYAVTAHEGQKVIHHSNVESDWMVDISTEMANNYYDHIKLEVLRWSEDTASDHIAFVDEGFHGTDFVRYGVNPYYHTSEDKIEHMNITYLKKVCNLTLATVSKIASLNPILKSDDLKIIMKGTVLSKPSQIYIKVENKRHEIDTANVTINVSLTHIFRNKYVQAIKKHYKIPCSWHLTKEIEDYFEFLIGGRKYTRGLFKFEVIVQGIKDDLHLYKNQVTYGWIINKARVIMLPRL